MARKVAGLRISQTDARADMPCEFCGKPGLALEDEREPGGYRGVCANCLVGAVLEAMDGHRDDEAIMEQTARMMQQT